MSTDAIELPNPPAIPGLAFRHFRGSEDFPPMAAVITASVEADKLERVQTAAELERNYSHLNNSDPAQDMIMAEIDGTVVAYGRVEWAKLDGGERTYTHIGYVRPDWRRHGLGRAILHHHQRRLREIAADHPQDGPRFFEANGSDTEPAAEALLTSEGYSPIRHFFYMVRPHLNDIPDLPLPAGLAVRPVTPADYAPVFAALNEAFRDHWGFTPLTEAQIQGMMDSPYFQPQHWQIAFEITSGEVAGLVFGSVNERENEKYQRQRGYTDPIGVRRPWRKQGLARALIARSLAELRSLGLTEAALTVDTENPSGALRLYEGLGYRPVKRGSVYRRPMD